MLHLPRAVHENCHVKQIELPLPAGIPGDAPDAVGGVQAHRQDGAGCGRAAVGKAVQRHRLGGGRPDANRGHIAIPGDAQVAVIGVQIVQHAGNLQPGGVDGFTVAVHGRNRYLPLQDVRHQRQAVCRDAQGRQARQVGELRLHLGAQVASLQLDGRTAADTAVGGAQAAVGGVNQIVSQAAVARFGPGDGLFIQPVGALLVQVARIGSRAAEEGG